VGGGQAKRPACMMMLLALLEGDASFPGSLSDLIRIPGYK